MFCEHLQSTAQQAVTAWHLSSLLISVQDANLQRAAADPTYVHLRYCDTRARMRCFDELKPRIDCKFCMQAEEVDLEAADLSPCTIYWDCMCLAPHAGCDAFQAHCSRSALCASAHLWSCLPSWFYHLAALTGFGLLLWHVLFHQPAHYVRSLSCHPRVSSGTSRTDLCSLDQPGAPQFLVVQHSLVVCR